MNMPEPTIPDRSQNTTQADWDNIKSPTLDDLDVLGAVAAAHVAAMTSPLVPTLHCSCWKSEAEPCCWCLDDSDDAEGSPPPPPCTRSRVADCITDLRDEVKAAEDRLFEADRARQDAFDAAVSS